MANNMRYFIGNWKMFGVPKSINILEKIDLGKEMETLKLLAEYMVNRNK